MIIKVEFGTPKLFTVSEGEEELTLAALDKDGKVIYSGDALTNEIAGVVAQASGILYGHKDITEELRKLPRLI